MNQPGKSDWATLYQAAITFKEATPWDWMDNEELFAVENPDDGEKASLYEHFSGRYV